MPTLFKYPSNKILLFSFVLIVLFSCNKRELTNDEKKWNPYVENQKITFKSDDGRDLNLTVSKIEITKQRTNVYAGNLSKKKESLVVFTKDDITGEEHVLLAVYKDSKGVGHINFVLNLPNTIDVNHVESINDVEEMTGIYGNYKDAVVIAPSINIGGDVTTPHVTNFVFSKSIGYLNYILSDGSAWSLN